jgi:hypothetical protein
VLRSAGDAAQAESSAAEPAYADAA